jgi:hypothetical protein
LRENLCQSSRKNYRKVWAKFSWVIRRRL